jgi:hypothetical protein
MKTSLHPPANALFVLLGLAACLKLLVGANWVDYSKARDLTTQVEAVFSLGWKF